MSTYFSKTLMPSMCISVRSGVCVCAIVASLTNVYASRVWELYAEDQATMNLLAASQSGSFPLAKKLAAKVFRVKALSTGAARPHADLMRRMNGSFCIARFFMASCSTRLILVTLLLSWEI
jgi:hypothetical protein